MVKETVSEKLRTLLHPGRKTTASDSESIVSLIKKAPREPKQTPAVAPTPYNGDQCFGSCCRGSGYAR
ncbi:hypothetical protein BJY04DRAFT_199327 [Aspergillus karnatakaensis]|uniref:uncharacterized protein n=1 Tax=Aspergillus karnatakaensis TaxID=1810916 RepID=UPI003CCCCA18